MYAWLASYLEYKAMEQIKDWQAYVLHKHGMDVGFMVLAGNSSISSWITARVTLGSLCLQEKAIERSKISIC